MFYYGSRLPHWHPPGHDLFLTVRLTGSVPAAVLDQLYHDAMEAERCAQAEHSTVAADIARLQAQRRFMIVLEHHLEHGNTGADWLRQPDIQQVVLRALIHQHTANHYQLLAACIMPNHLHVVLRLLQTSTRDFKLAWEDFKRYTGRKANQHLARKGRFWEDESYDLKLRSNFLTSQMIYF